jgi:hypothetical protein
MVQLQIIFLCFVPIDNFKPFILWEKLHFTVLAMSCDYPKEIGFFS